MNPRDLENRAVKDLEGQGYMVQKALFSIKHLPNGKILSNRSDFFSVWDIMAVKADECIFMQVCSGTTYQEHVRKIERAFPHTSWARQIIRYYYKEKNRWTYADHVRYWGMGWIETKEAIDKYGSRGD